MNQFNLGNFVNRFINNSLLNSKRGTPNSHNSNINTEFSFSNEIINQNLLQRAIKKSGMLKAFNFPNLAHLRMNNLANLERSLYIKDLMNLPKEIEEVLVILQNNNAATKNLTKLLTTNINLAGLAELLQKNGKEAMNKLVLAMSEASKQGITDLSQFKEAMKFINASVAVASQENPSQVLKNFMLLYLPWLPLQEGVDFSLEIETYQNEAGESETSITILISTVNYGNVKVLLILHGINSIDIFVNCSGKFPKEELLKRINTESKNHSIQTNVAFEQKETRQNENDIRQAKISMSNITEVNPFLLLMANAVIRNTIDLDNQV